MANTYSWVISKLDCFSQKDGRQDVVLNIHWRRNADDGQGHTAETHGMQTLVLDPDAPFVPFESLTFEQVCAWLESALQNEIVNPPDDRPDKEPDPDYVAITRIESINSTLDWLIAQQIAPPVISPPLPWGAE